MRAGQEGAGGVEDVVRIGRIAHLLDAQWAAPPGEEQRRHLGQALVAGPRDLQRRAARRCVGSDIGDHITLPHTVVPDAFAGRGYASALAKAALGYARTHGLKVIPMPHCDRLIAPIVFTVPLQLLAYHVAVLKGTDVDQPRNLAKSVTVE